MRLARTGKLKKIFIFGGIFLFLFPLIVSAQTSGNLLTNSDPCVISDWSRAIKLQFEIPNVTQVYEGSHYVKDLGCYIVGLYKYFAGVAGILTIVFVMYGGVRYVVSMGNQQKVSQAKDTITSALVGLLLVMGSYAILYFINPNLTTFNLDFSDSIIRLSEGTLWCDESANAHGGTTNCGDTGTMMVNGIETTCYYRGQCTTGEICSQTETGHECVNALRACETYGPLMGTPPTGCGMIDAEFAKAGHNNFVCAAVAKPLNPHEFECKYIGALHCGGQEGGKYWEQLPCADGTTVGNADSCFRNGAPSEYGHGQTCVDGRAASGEQSICCVDTQDVDCRTIEISLNNQNSTFCNDDEIESSTCELLGRSFIQENGGPASSCTQGQIDSGNYRCCFEADLVG